MPARSMCGDPNLRERIAVHRFVRVLVCAAAVPAALLLGSSTAQAGTYSFDQNTSADSHGWWWKSDPGYVGCSRDSRPGACADADVPKPTALRLFMKGTVAKDSYAVWRWDIPGGMTLVSGSVDVAYAVTADTRRVAEERGRGIAAEALPAQLRRKRDVDHPR